MSLTVSVVVPAYNEQDTIQRVITALIEHVPQILEIIVVDDGSTDATRAVVSRMAATHPQVNLLVSSTNKGKTAALRAGFAASRGDIVLVQDADLEYDPGDIPGLIQPILDNWADVVYGSRFLVRRAARVLYFKHYLANRFLTFLSNLLTDMNFTDVETGYKAFRGEIARNMIIESSGFGFEVEVTAKVAKLRCRTYEVPISYHGRTYEEGKKIGIQDGLLAILWILKYNLLCDLRRSFTRVPKL